MILIYINGIFHQNNSSPGRSGTVRPSLNLGLWRASRSEKRGVKHGENGEIWRGKMVLPLLYGLYWSGNGEIWSGNIAIFYALKYGVTIIIYLMLLVSFYIME